MPVVKISSEELKKSVRIKAGWYRAVVKECKPEPSSDKKSINYNWYFRVDDHGVEREIRHAVNQAVLASLGTPIIEACLSKENEPFKIDKDGGKDFEFDTDLVAGKSICIKFEDEPYQGNLIAKPKIFLPGYVDVDNIPF